MSYQKEKRYRENRLKEGWKWVGLLLPPDIAESVVNYKNELMTKRKEALLLQKRKEYYDAHPEWKRPEGV